MSYLDLQTASTALLASISPLGLPPSRALSVLEQWASASTPSASQSDLLDGLAELLIHPACTTEVAIHFRPLLLELCMRSLEALDNQQCTWSSPATDEVLHAFASLLVPFPESYGVVRLLLEKDSLGEDGTLSSLPDSDSRELQSVLLSVYRLSCAAPLMWENVSHRCPVSVLHSLFSNAATPTTFSATTRLLAIRAFAAIETLSEAARLRLEEEFVGRPVDPGSMDQEGYVEAVYDSRSERIDVWTMPLLEAERAARIRLRLNREIRTSIDPALLRPRVASVGGVLVLRASDAYADARLGDDLSENVRHSSSFKETQGLQDVLAGLARNMDAATLLSGPEASGKTTMLAHLCGLVHPRQQPLPILTLQLGDQSGLDAKSLLGSFVSSSTRPGTFEWSEGALTRAVRQGKWVVLEDIDKASSEILSVIKPLAESLGRSKLIGSRPMLDLGSRGKMRAGPGFALFATRTIVMPSREDRWPPTTFLGHTHFQEIKVQPLTQDDIIEITAQSNPVLAAASDDALLRLVSTWSTVVAGSKRQTNGTVATKRRMKLSAALTTATATPTGTLRTPSLHDLIKWCRRVERLLEKSGRGSAVGRAPFSNQVVHEEIFIEACDVFLGSLAAHDSHDNSRHASVVEVLSQSLGIDTEQAWLSIRGRMPEMGLVKGGASSTSAIRVGRCQLDRSSPLAQGPFPVAPVSKKFALTRPAAQLLERLAVCVSMAEPALIVGETGTGKTTVVQHLASLVGKPMVALNLSQQTESSDLLGGYRPLDAKIPAMELHNRWIGLFEKTFSSRRNARFVEAERKALKAEKWARLADIWRESSKMAAAKAKKEAELGLEEEGQKDSAEAIADSSEEGAARKKRRTGTSTKVSTPPLPEANGSSSKGNSNDENDEWLQFAGDAQQFRLQHAAKQRSLVFSFIEGPLVKAIRTGAWVLLDEVNLAAPETLDCLAGLLQTPTSSVTLTERGDLEPVPRHPDFRLFACMNPATDVGKRDLPSSLRNRFTELYAASPDSDREALVSIVDKYIGQHVQGDRGAVMDVAECFLAIRRLAHNHELADGANQRPHYSIRTLSRALTFASDVCGIYGLRRSLWEGFVMAFTMLLEPKSNQMVRSLVHANILAKAKNARSVAAFVPPAPSSGHVQMGPFWLEAGSLAPQLAEDYVLTASVQEKVVGLARAALTRKSPVLIQGPTSAGKTSAVEYLARRTGHRFVRINNHEHTDIQEYIGSYSSDPDSGRLVFREGLLVSALRRGDWIVLDELNLAPTDVLEALNRLLDDNRELLIPETGEVVRPHPHFMLFATQNPPGLYAGRKVLSRAFRNRFLEVHFDDVPQPELETILTRRCAIAPSYAAKIVAVFVELQRRRQAGRVFDSKQAFVTLRDLFRWGQREAVGYQELAENGYMLIAERARRAEDQVVVREVIEDVLNVRLDVENLYRLSASHRQKLESRLGEDYADAILARANTSGLVWTEAMQRLLSLVATALRYDEPVLLVGETGTGKTSICEMLADVLGRKLHTVNCHQNTDTADLLGGQRPLRNRAALQAKARAQCNEVLSRLLAQEEDVNPDLQTASAKLASLLANTAAEWDEEKCSKEEARSALRSANQSLALFEWHDGPLVEAMRQGDHVLLDEISLADDSVLERLNSVLEPARTVVLAERGSSSSNRSSEEDTATLRATAGFQVVATMNPGGDYGKKELSPALRNRFTEIWVPHVEARSDLLMILDRQWAGMDTRSMQRWSAAMLDFTDWFAAEIGGRDAANIGLRDLIAWTAFVKSVIVRGEMQVAVAFIHGALLCIVDGIGTLPATSSMTRDGLERLRLRCHTKLSDLAGDEGGSQAMEEALLPAQVSMQEDGRLTVGSFLLEVGQQIDESASPSFSFGAQTPANNALRVVRALQIPNKSIMLEGSPGAGKTSLIVALAQASGHALTRINLSDQTELVDLFGADLPVEGGAPGEFSWRDAAFLSAMQRGEWVLLDEMNLASQSVLEGLNSCLDHRGAVYVPELGRSFHKHPSFRIFAAQNPHHQGGGRKGLPKSFLNRFTKVYVQALEPQDIETIAGHLFPHFDPVSLKRMIRFNASLHEETMVRHSFGRTGAPWEFNLRDLLRWLHLLHANLGLNWRGKDPLEHLASMYILRFRTVRDREAAAELFRRTFERQEPIDVRGYRPWPLLTAHRAQFGHVVLNRNTLQDGGKAAYQSSNLGMQREQLPALEALAECIKMAWPAILCGPSQSGKTSLVRYMAHLTGNELEELRMSSGTDTMDVLGGFEQMDPLAGVTKQAQRLLDITGRVKSSQPGRMGQQGFEDVCVAQARLHALLEEVATTDGASAPRTKMRDEVAKVASSLLSKDLVKDLDRDACSQIYASAASASSAEEESRDGGKFAWIDGPLLKAMKQGKWLLLDDANLCSASVLDRLNSLLEPGGSVVLSERGVVGGSSSSDEDGSGELDQVPVIRPHANFRIFLTLDPRHGELSRAMRNRGLEICLTGPAASMTNTSFEAHVLSQDSELVLAKQWSSTLVDQEEEQSSEGGLVRELTAAHLIGSLPRKTLALASRLRKDDALPVELFSQDERSAQAVKATFARQQANLDAAFLSELGPSLRMNPNLVGFVNSDTYSACLSLGVRVLFHSLDLDKVMESASRKSTTKKDELTVLERSAGLLTTEGSSAQHMSNGGSSSDGHEAATFPLVRSVLMASRAFLGLLNGMIVSEGKEEEGADRARLLSEWLAKLLDQTTFLALTWASHRQFDFSATTVVAREMDKLLSTDLVSGFGGAFEEEAIGKRLASLGAKRMLKSGLAMERIWRANINAGGQQGPQELSIDAEMADALEELKRGLEGADRQRRDIIMNAVDVAATLDLAVLGAGQHDTMNAQRQEVLDIAARVRQSLETIQRGKGEANISEDDDRLSEGESLTLSSLILLWSSAVNEQGGDGGRGGLQDLIELIKSSKRYALTPAVALRRLSWKSSDALETQMLVDVVDGLWKDRINSEGARSGTQDLFRPLLLASTLRRCLPRRTALAEVEQRKESLTWLASALGLSLGPDRKASTRNALVQTFDHLSECLWGTIEELQPGIAQHIALSTDRKAILESLKMDVPLTHSRESEAVTSIISDWIECAEQVQEETPSLAQLGASMVRFVSSMIHLYVPDVPLDPLAVQRTKEALTEHALNRIDVERTMLQQRAKLITGSIAPSLLWTQALDQRAMELTSSSLSNESKVVIKRGPAPLDVLARLHGEMKSFIDQILQRAKLMDLVDRLAAEAGSSKEEDDDHLRLVAQLANLQASISSLLDRLRTIYASLQDLCQPLSLCLSLMQLGLGALVQHARYKKRSAMASKNAEVVDMLVRYPTIDASGRFSNLLEVPLRLRADSRHGSLAVPMLLTKLAAVEHDASHGAPIPAHFVERVSRSYDQLAHLWNLDRQRERKEEQESKSLYKSQKINVEVEDDDVLQEREFATLFPEFEDVMTLRADSTISAENGTKQQHAKAKDFFSTEAFVKLYRMHMTLFSSESLRKANRQFADWRMDVINRLVGLHYQEMDESLDSVSKALQLDLIASKLPKQEGDGALSASDREFYRETASSEQVAQMLRVVDAMKTRLELLMGQYPDQMVLSDLRDRCEAILSLDAGTSPVARLLSALEQLLLHTEDWQAFASSQTSLVEQRSLVSSLIIEWRRLELSSWAKILERHHQEVKDADGEKYWFHLFETAIRAPCQRGNAADDDDEETNTKLVSLLDEYIRTANLGQWQARLDLLASFARYARLLASSSSHFPRLDTVAKVLFNVVAFYSQHAQGVEAHLERRRSVIEREIADYIKLASWKDVNVFALQQSAKQTHRKLHKCIRKFRDVLRLPVDPILAELGEAQSKAKHLSEDDISTDALPEMVKSEARTVAFRDELRPRWHGEAQVSAHLLDLAMTWRRLERLTSQKLGKAIMQSPSVTGSGLISLAAQVLERSEALRKQTPATWTEETAKVIKSLETRKRKAWSDLLKELRRIGFSSAAQQKNQRIHEAAWVYSRNASDEHSEKAATDEVEKRYFGLLGLVPRVKGSITSPERSPDVLMSDLQRAQAVIEHASTMVVEVRQRSMELHSPLAKLRQFSDRIAKLSGSDSSSIRSSSAAATQEAKIEAVENLADALCKTLAALEETVQRCREQSRLLSSSANTGNFLSDLQSRIDAVRECKDGLVALAASCTASGLVVLTDDEASSIERCSIEMQGTMEALSFNASSPQRHLTIWTADLSRFVAAQMESIARCQSVLISSPGQEKGKQDRRQRQDEAGKKSDRIISSILVIVQDLTKIDAEESVKKEEVDDEDDDEELQEKAVPMQLRRLVKVESTLRIDEIMREILEFVSLCNGAESSTDDGDSLITAMQRLSPFVQRYVELIQAHIEASRRFVCALMRLVQVVCVLVVNLAKRGFCKPPPKEEEQSGKGGGEGQEALEDDDDGGTGLGDGSGMKDITDQLGEDEEMEELQKDEKDKDEEEEQGEKNKEKGAKEMEQDFEGELESVDGEDEEEQEGREKEEENEDGQMDEAVGDVDPLDPNAVDEKTWGGEDEEDQKDDKGKDETEKDLDGKNAEDGAQDDQKKTKGKKGKSKDKQANEGAGERGEEDGEEASKTEQDEADADNEPEEGEGEDNQKEDGLEDRSQEGEQEGEEEEDSNRMGRQIDQEATQGENLDLPDDLDIDGGGEEEDADDHDDDFSDLGDDEMNDDGQGQEDKKPDENGIEVDELPNEGEEKEQLDKMDEEAGPDDDNDMADGEVSKDKGEEAMDEEDVDEEAGQEDDGNDGQQGGQDQDQDQQLPSQSGQDQSGDAAPAPDAGDANQDDNNADQQSQSTRGAQGRMMMPMEETSSTSQQGAQRGGQSQSMPQQQQQQRQPPSAADDPSSMEDEKADVEQETGDGPDASQDRNPVRSLGDALRDFRRDLDAIEERMAREEEEKGDDQGGMPEDGDDRQTAFEHVDEQDQDQDMQQALGVANEDEAKNLDGILGGDDEDDENKKPPPPVEDGDEVMQSREELPFDVNNLQEEKQQEQQQNGQRQRGMLASDLVRGDQATDEKDEETESGNDQDLAAVDGEREEEDNDPLAEEEQQQLEESLEAQLAALTAQDDEDQDEDEERRERFDELWKTFASLTSDLSLQLCEQLRLILAPTLATRFAGDYKTGKRLNMRKIVPFIASDFAKDKIWLRRSKPAKREYQVLLSIDDSKSMREGTGKRVKLAYQTLVLLKAAMDRLEVGEIAIAKFGSKMELLRDFDSSPGGSVSSSEEGRILEKLTFEQRGTDVLNLVEDSLAYLARSRERTSSLSGKDLWQLQLIVSDGICQNHDKLRSLLRRAHEEKVMLVFVIVDCLQQSQPDTSTQQKQQSQEQQSIVDLSSVSYHTNAATGKLEIKMERYLDSFPFEYFVVVSNVEALPDVLATTLREWTQRIANM